MGAETEVRTMGTMPGDWVLLLERREEQVLVYQSMATRLSMDEALAGPLGHMSIDAAFVHSVAERMPTMMVANDVVHHTHRDWMEGRSAFAYEELPSLPSGICRYCLCTEQRACEQGCSWVDRRQTVCSSEECVAQWRAEMRKAQRGEVAHDGARVSA